MELNTIQDKGRWVEIAKAINDNFVKISLAINNGTGGGSSEGGSGMTPDEIMAFIDYYLGQKDFVDGGELYIALLGYATKTELTSVDDRLKAIETFFEEDDDELINKWNEIVDFLNNIEGDTLHSILATYAKKDDVDTQVSELNAAISLKANASDLGFYLPIGAAAESANKLNSQGVSDLNDAALGRMFYSDFQSANTPTGANYYAGFTLKQQYNNIVQLAISYYGKLHTRYYANDAWSNWNAIALTSDIPTALSQLTDDVVAGKYLPLSGGAVNGNVTIANVSRLKLNGGIFEFNNSSGDECCYLWGGIKKGVLSLHDGTSWQTILHSGNYSDYALPLSGGTLTGNLTAPKFIGALQGNADSATKLQTPRKIWGQEFDGTKDVDGNLSVNGVPFIRVGVTYTSFGDSSRITYIDGNKIQCNASGKPDMTINSDGNVGIGTSSPSAKLDVNGNIKSSSWYGAGISIGCGSDGTASSTYSNEINCFGSTLYLQHRTGRITMCANGGFVGIGRDSAEATLEVNGSTIIRGSIYFSKGQAALYAKAKDDTSDVIFNQVNPDGHLLLGQGVAKDGGDTLIYGNNIWFCYGTAGTRSSTALQIDSTGNTTINGNLTQIKDGITISLSNLYERIVALETELAALK